MNEQEFTRYNGEETEPVIRAADFTDKGNRTLCVGYNFEREDFEVTLINDEIIVFEAGRSRSGTEFPAADLRPRKRAYPRDTDYDFAVAMRQAGEPLTFTRWDR